MMGLSLSCSQQQSLDFGLQTRLLEARAGHQDGNPCRGGFEAQRLRRIGGPHRQHLKHVL